MTEAWSCAIIKIPVNEKRKVRNMSIYDTLNDKQQEAVYHTAVSYTHLMDMTP